MRTTLDLDDDILQAAKELAATTGSTAGRVVSDLARRGLARPAPASRLRNGVPPLPGRKPGTPTPTMSLVNRLRDDV